MTDYLRGLATHGVSAHPATLAKSGDRIATNGAVPRTGVEAPGEHPVDAALPPYERACSFFRRVRLDDARSTQYDHRALGRIWLVPGDAVIGASVLESLLG